MPTRVPMMSSIADGSLDRHRLTLVIDWVMEEGVGIAQDGPIMRACSIPFDSIDSGGSGSGGQRCAWLLCFVNGREMDVHRRMRVDR